MTPEELMPHLPHLRRYARLLTGQQPAGDAMVELMLERLLDSPLNLATDSAYTSTRTALYRSLVDVLWEHRDVHQSGDRNGIIDTRLMALNPIAREVFLLVNVEQFSLAEAAEVLDMTPGEVAQQLEIAGREIAGQMATSVLIIEDEPLIALTIETIVLEMGHAVIGVAHTKEQALSMAKESKPGLILADIQLADGSSGLEAVREIDTDEMTPAIFITAFPERVLTGVKPEPAFLIAKPFQAEHVKAVVSQTLFVRG